MPTKARPFYGADRCERHPKSWVLAVLQKLCFSFILLRMHLPTYLHTFVKSVHFFQILILVLVDGTAHQAPADAHGDINTAVPTVC